ncbi:antirestriction ArdB family protein [Yersinia intermedia]|uniref:Antirestriction ArdB family protein n=1 Tax=Yersinia aldovae TaxID=29483 RepID=A0ABM9SWJ7_YERAL|nr:antirestriction ArdB family protein [Yersinia intermedia]CNL16199.1 antirestriction ArdB family protein [Yersinia aldovae]
MPNGGAFMVPGTEQDYVLLNALNGNGATISREAAGITACLMAYSHHTCRTESEEMTEHFYRLREYALQHIESNAIFSLID